MGRISNSSHPIDITGNSATTTKLKTPVNIAGTAFDGTKNIDIGHTYSLLINDNAAGYAVFARIPYMRDATNICFLISCGTWPYVTSVYILQATIEYIGVVDPNVVRYNLVRLVDGHNISAEEFGFYMDKNYLYFGLKHTSYWLGNFSVLNAYSKSEVALFYKGTDVPSESWSTFTQSNSFTVEKLQNNYPMHSPSGWNTSISNEMLLAKSGWYRIANTYESIQIRDGIFRVMVSKNGNISSAIFSASTAYALENTTFLQQISFTSYKYPNLTKARIVYPKVNEDYAGKYSYVDVYIEAGSRMEVNFGFGNWYKVSPALIKSIPDDYTSKEITFSVGGIKTE